MEGHVLRETYVSHDCLFIKSSLYIKEIYFMFTVKFDTGKNFFIYESKNTLPVGSWNVTDHNMPVEVQNELNEVFLRNKRIPAFYHNPNSRYTVKVARSYR